MVGCPDRVFELSIDKQSPNPEGLRSSERKASDKEADAFDELRKQEVLCEVPEANLYFGKAYLAYLLP